MPYIDFLFDPGTDIEPRANAVWEAFVESEDSTAKGPTHWNHSRSFRYQGLGINALQHTESSPPLEYFGVPEVPYIELSIPEDPFMEAILDDETDPEPTFETVLEMVRIIYGAVDDLAYGFGRTPGMATQIHEGRLRLPITEGGLAATEIEYAVWLMVFPPRVVQTYGRETLLSAPAYHVEEFDDGGILLAAGPNPLMYPDTKPIDDHLGLDSPSIEDTAY